MQVFPGLSKNAWKVLLTLTEQPCQASEIAKKTGLGLNRIAEALDQLEKCNIIPSRKRKTIMTFDSSLRNTLKDLLTDYHKDILVDSFEGKKLNTLFQILDGYDTIAKLKLVTGHSTPTLKRITDRLQRKLFIFQPKKGIYHIRNAFKPQIKLLYSSFFAHYSDLLEKQGITWKKIKLFGSAVIIESNQDSIPGFVRTSFSRFHEYKVELFLTNYNYFVNSNKEQTMEEIFIHALADSARDYRQMMYCTLFADLNKLTLKQLKNLPIIFRVENEAKQIFDYLASNGKTKTENDFLTPYKEYLEVRGDYARY